MTRRSRPRLRRDQPDGAPARSVFMDVYAHMAREYMDMSGATAEDFANIAVKAHRHGALNPKAQYGEEVSTEAVLASRGVVDPLTLLMCSPLSDGAAALVLATERGLERMSADPVRVLAATLVSGGDRPTAALRRRNALPNSHTHRPGSRRSRST